MRVKLLREITRNYAYFTAQKKNYKTNREK